MTRSVYELDHVSQLAYSLHTVGKDQNTKYQYIKHSITQFMVQLKWKISKAINAKMTRIRPSRLPLAIIYNVGPIGSFTFVERV